MLGLIMGIARLEHQASGGEAGDENGEVGHGERLVAEETGEIGHVGFTNEEAMCPADDVVTGADGLGAQRASRLVEAHDIGQRHDIALQAIIGENSALAEKGC